MLEKILSPETYAMLIEWALSFCKNLIVALVVYFIGRFLIKWGTRLITKLLERSKVDKSLYTFLTSIVNVVSQVICWMSVFSGFLKLGVTT